MNIIDLTLLVVLVIIPLSLYFVYSYWKIYKYFHITTRLKLFFHIKAMKKKLRQNNNAIPPAIRPKFYYLAMPVMVIVVMFCFPILVILLSISYHGIDSWLQTSDVFSLCIVWFLFLYCVLRAIAFIIVYFTMDEIYEKKGGIFILHNGHLTFLKARHYDVVIDYRECFNLAGIPLAYWGRQAFSLVRFYEKEGKECVCECCIVHWYRIDVIRADIILGRLFRKLHYDVTYSKTTSF